MFQNQRYLTRGVQETIPLELQLLMWNPGQDSCRFEGASD